MDYLQEIKKEFPHITPFEEDDDVWDSLGYECLTSNDFKSAEVFFKKLCLSQPRHHAGYEGLAALYSLQNQKEKALWFMDRAISLAKKFLLDHTIDVDSIEEMKENYSNIQNNKELNRWW